MVIISFIVRYAKISLTTMIAKLDIMKGIVKETQRDDAIIESVAERMEFFRTEGNIFYQVRGDILFIGAIGIIYVLWRRYGKQFTQYNSTLWGLILIIFAFANFGFANLIFYDRVYKIVLLLLYIYLFLFLVTVEEGISFRAKVWMSVFSLIPVLYAVATIVVSQREYLWNLQLWFNNFFLGT